MSAWDAVLLGIVQGATEFLPVSSSGHLVIVQALLGIRIPGVVFEVAVHVATLVSVLIVYRVRVATLVVGSVRGDGGAWRYLGLLAVATVPAAVLGLSAGDRIEALFENPAVPGFALLVTGAVLWSARSRLERARSTDPGLLAAFLIGIAQAVALVPGISRSGSTVVAALWLGVEAREAAAFSFLMAVPAIAGAAVLKLGALETVGSAGWSLVLGGVVAGATGVVAIRTFVRMLERRSFHHFAPYCWAVGGLFLVYLWLR